MAGLNDDVEEGLEPYIQPHDTNPDAAEAPAVLLVNKTDPVQEEDDCPNNVTAKQLFGGPIVPGELPDLNAEFEIVEDASNKVTDLVEVRQAISGSCGVCTEDAKLVDSLVPGFITERKPLGFYTETKSKTQFKETLVSLDTEIDTNIEKLAESIEASSAKMLERLVPAAEAFKANITTALTKYQPVLAAITVAVGGVEDGNAAMIDYLNMLDRIIDGGDFHAASENLDPVYVRLGEIRRRLENSKNIGNLVNPDRTAVRSVFVIEGVPYEFVEEEPYLKPAAEEGDNRFRNYGTYLGALRHGLDMVSLTYLQTLAQVSVNLNTAMAGSIALVKELNGTPAKSLKDKYDFLMRIAAVNNAYAFKNLEILLFAKDYFDFIDTMAEQALRLAGSNGFVSTQLTAQA